MCKVCGKPTYSTGRRGGRPPARCPQCIATAPGPDLKRRRGAPRDPGSARSHRREVDDKVFLLTACWCESENLWVNADTVRAGRTRSCGTDDCRVAT